MVVAPQSILRNEFLHKMGISMNDMRIRCGPWRTGAEFTEFCKNSDKATDLDARRPCFPARWRTPPPFDNKGLHMGTRGATTEMRDADAGGHCANCPTSAAVSMQLAASPLKHGAGPEAIKLALTLRHQAKRLATALRPDS